VFTFVRNRRSESSGTRKYLPDGPQAVEQLRRFANLWEALTKTVTAARAAYRRPEKKLTRYVDSKVRERGRLGKRRADEALSKLIAEVTSTNRTHHAIRVLRSRLKAKEPKVQRDKVKHARRLPGSQLAIRKTRYRKPEY